MNEVDMTTKKENDTLTITGLDDRQATMVRIANLIVAQRVNKRKKKPSTRRKAHRDG